MRFHGEKVLNGERGGLPLSFELPREDRGQVYKNGKGVYSITYIKEREYYK